MKVAAYQASLDSCFGDTAIPLLRQQIDRCERLGVELLCCPEAVIGGLADYVDPPARAALRSDNGDLARALAPLASPIVTTVLGFTEIDRDGHLYNSAAVLARGGVQGIYRKRHPAINRSVYRAGTDAPVFTVGDVTFGVLICRDSTFAEPARTLVDRGARVLLVPTNNGMPPSRGGAELVVQARECDVARAAADGVAVIRADVAGAGSELVSHGASAIVDRSGQLLVAAQPLVPDLIVGEVDVAL